MLKYLSIKNFGPFKNLTEWHNDIINEHNAEYYDHGVASAAMIYGKSMAGKTAFIDALKFLRELMAGDGKIGYRYSDCYFNGPKDGIECRDEETEFILEFVTHETQYRYEISMNLHDRRIINESLLYRDCNTKKRFKKAFIREGSTDVKINIDIGEFGPLLEKYFNDFDETLLHRIAVTHDGLSVTEIAEPYNFMKLTLHFVDDDSFIITETGMNFKDIIIPNLMEKLEEMEAPVDGYWLLERTDSQFIDRYNFNDAKEIRALMDYYESDSVNIAIINKCGIFFITNSVETVYKCYQLKLSKNDIRVESRGLLNMVRLALMLNFNDDAVYVYDEFGSSLDERIATSFFEMWKSTVSYKQIIASCTNTNLMKCLNRADINFVSQDVKHVSTIVNPAKDLKWRSDLILEKAYLEKM